MSAPNKEDIIRMAREAGANMLHGGEHSLFGDAALKRFAALVAAAQPALEPVAIPDDVRKAAQAMKKDGYRGPLAWACKVIDFVADYTTPPAPLPAQPAQPAQRQPMTEQEIESRFEAWIDSDDWKKHVSRIEYPISHMGMQQLSIDCMLLAWKAAHIGAKP